MNRSVQLLVKRKLEIKGVFYANRVNSWLVIQNFSDPCRIQAHGMTLKLRNPRKRGELWKSCLLSRQKVAGTECREGIVEKVLYNRLGKG